MKNIFLTYLFLAVPLALFSQQSYKISGSVENLQSKVYIYAVSQQQGVDVKDSVALYPKDNKFEFIGETTEPKEVILTLDRKQGGIDSKEELKMYVLKGETHIRVNGSLKDAQVQGESINEEFIKYQNLIGEYDKALKKIEYTVVSKSWDNSESDVEMTNKLAEEYMRLSEKKLEKQLRFIKNTPDSYFTLIALRDIAKNEKYSYAHFTEQFQKLPDEVRQSSLGEWFEAKIEEEVKPKNYTMAPDFTMDDVDGNPVSLSDFRGKYVLIDFWASWCGPCRAENPNYVKIYNKFKDKDFEILGVSLDRPGRKQDWLNAIEKDQLTWVNVSDLKFWESEVVSLYEIHSLPKNVLINTKGEIIAENIYGLTLEVMLNKIL